MKKSKEVSNYILIVAFFAMLILPVLFMNRVDGKISGIENRILSSKPEMFNSDGLLNANFINEYESYIDDNIGFKETSTAVNLILKYKIFGIFDSPNWLLGKNENFFYTTGGEDIDTYVGLNCYDESTMKEMTDNLLSMNEYFEQIGCSTYYMFIPNKEEVYSELYSPYAIKSDQTRMQLFEAYLIEHTELNVIDTLDALTSRKEEQLYYKSYDASHWNMNGAMIGYGELMEAISNDYSSVSVIDDDEFVVRKEPFEGLMQYQSENSLISNCFDIQDTIYSYDLKNGFHAILDEHPMGGREIDPNLNFYHYYNPSMDNGETLMIVGDSYMYCFLLPYLAESFKHVYFVRNTYADVIADLASEIQPSVFVFEVAERVFYKYYFDYMSGYSKYITYDIDSYMTINQISEVHVDWPILVDGCIPISDDEYTCIMGWAWDNINSKPPEKVLIEVNGKIYDAEFYYRGDLIDMGEVYCNCAFQVYVENENLLQDSDVSFYVITADREKYKVFTLGTSINE